MECAIITTYRCNAKCDMCKIYERPTRQEEEFEPSLLNKLPNGLERVNITGGEPTLRKDLLEIVSILKNKAKKIDISTNGYYPDRLVEISRKYPDVIIRISAEGLPKLNDELRGLKNGFDHSLRAVIALKGIGAKDIGYGMVISDKNIEDLLMLYELCVMMGIEFTTSTLHNSFYFNKMDNKIADKHRIEVIMREFIKRLLSSKRSSLKKRAKDWARAYLNYGILNHIINGTRLLPCGAAVDLFFLDPFGKILACNGSEEPWVMGDLKQQTFEEIWFSDRAEKVREMVKNCKRGCWMVGSARPAIRKYLIKSLYWVFNNKIRLLMGKDILL